MVPLSALLDLEFQTDRCQEVIKLVELETALICLEKSLLWNVKCRKARQAEKKIVQAGKRESLHLLRGNFLY